MNEKTLEIIKDLGIKGTFRKLIIVQHRLGTIDFIKCMRRKYSDEIIKFCIDYAHSKIPITKKILQNKYEK